ncbi:Xaa-Pro APN2 [Rhyzopertha dominica]|nr:Xaa-Pro APN2 [Rhyzopertha dominica]
MPRMKSTSSLLKQLRALMKDINYVPEPLQAYIIPSGDAHNSEYLAKSEARRAYISGFTGSAGTAIVTENEACLWTDGRYYIQAAQQMDDNWTLMKDGLPSTPTQGTWLVKNLPRGSKVGADPKLVTNLEWMPLKTQLEKAGHSLVPVLTNLVDVIWTDKPSFPSNPIKPLPLKYTGKTVGEKLMDIRNQMNEKNATALVITALDEIAWVLNLRGSDIPYNPVFFAYVIVEQNCINIFIELKRFTDNIQTHLRNEAPNETIKVLAYEDISKYIADMCRNLTGSVWLAETASFALVDLIPQKSLFTEITPVCLMKCIKNDVERQSLRNAHIKDAAAVCCYFAWLEAALANGERVTEISGANKLESFRAMQEDYVGLSFDTISSVGPHGAIIHYSPDESSDVEITTRDIYLCDSGGQYLDGTTDITRVMHFGTPTPYEKECYTYVLKGQLQLGTAVFPRKLRGNFLDSYARQYLWQVGLDYPHGTGHGVGAYLNVHEGPSGVHWRHNPQDPGLDEGMFLSNEPGYYEDGKFGLRIEDVVEVVKANTPYNFKEKGFLTFDTITLVPKQQKLIHTSMLTDAEVTLLNAYHQKCRDVVGPLLERQGQIEAKNWLWRETTPIQKSA